MLNSMSERYPISGELLLNEIAKLPEEERAKLNYEGIVKVVSEEIAIRALKETLQYENEKVMAELDGEE